MKILVIGATGRLGRELVKHALDKDHMVTAFARNIEDLQIEHPNLRLVRGDVLYPTLIEAAIVGHDAVLSVIGLRKFSGPITLLSRGVRNIVEAMQKHDIPRLITVTGAGILQETEDRMIMETLSFPPNLQNISLDHRRVFKLLQESQLDWTIVCPAFMVRRPATGNYITRENHYPTGALNEVPLADVADFITDEIRNNQFLCSRVGIAEMANADAEVELGI